MSDNRVDDENRHGREETDDYPSKKSKKQRRSNNDADVHREYIEHFQVETFVDDNSKVKSEAPSNFDNLHASNLPSSDYYEKSYMHRDVVTHVIVTSTDFLITGSFDGHIKFWKILTEDYLKQQLTTPVYQSNKANDDKDRSVNFSNGPIEFVKHFRAHLGTCSTHRMIFVSIVLVFVGVSGPIVTLTVNQQGTLLCSTCADRTVKMFDVLGFDMITMVKLDFVPLACSFVHSSRHALSTLAISDSQSPTIYLYDGKTLNVKEPISVLSKLGHPSPVSIISYCPQFDLAISCDSSSIINYWSANQSGNKAENVLFESKLDTDLFKLAQRKQTAMALEFSPDGKRFALLARSSTERKLYLFDTLKGKILKTIDEHLNVYKDLHEQLQVKQEESQKSEEKKSSLNMLNNVEYSRRLTIEKDFEKNEVFYSLINFQFDRSGTFLFFSTLYGIKMLNLRTNTIRHFFGTTENARFIRLALYQSQKATSNESISSILFSTAYKKNRFYLFTRNNPRGQFSRVDDIVLLEPFVSLLDSRSEQDNDRDVYNEKPSREEILTATEEQALSSLSQSAVLHTTLGDIHVKLFPEFCPKTCENFIQHSKQSYYNGCIFHRVIKQFMIQTGLIVQQQRRIERHFSF